MPRLTVHYAIRLGEGKGDPESRQKWYEGPKHGAESRVGPFRQAPARIHTEHKKHGKPSQGTADDESYAGESGAVLGCVEIEGLGVDHGMAITRSSVGA